MASVAKRPWTHKGVTKEAWVVRYKDAGGVHRSRQFALKKQADEYRRKVERELDDGTHVARRGSRTVAMLIDEFLADLSRRVAEGQVGQSYYNQTSLGLRYALPTLGKVLASELTWQQVEAYGRRLRQQQSRTHKRPLSPGTIRVALNSLQMAVSYGVRRAYAVRNVVADALKELGSMPARPIDTFDREEMRRIVAAIEEPVTRAGLRGQAMVRAIVYLGCMCGLRRGEIMALRWKDLDLIGGWVNVRHSLTADDVMKDPKTAKGKRPVPLPRMAVEALEAWRPFVVPHNRQLIFRTKHGGIIRASDFYADLWHKVLDRADISRPATGGWKHFHATRHFAGSAWLAAGVSLPEVSRLMGHANVAITARVYSHAIEEVTHRAGVLDQCAATLAQPQPRLITHELRNVA